MTLHDIVNQLNKRGVKLEAIYGQKYLYEVSKSRNTKPGFVKIAVTDEMADEIMRKGGIPLFIVLPLKEVEEILEEAEAKGGESE